MPFTIPNAIAYGVDIATLEQAEPDALDFQLLGDRRSFVISGGAITAAATHATEYITLTLSSAEVYIDGVYGTVTGTTVTIPAAPSSGTRFDLVCARYNSGTWSFYIVDGTATASTTNPTFPVFPPTSASGSFVVLYAVTVRSDLKSSTLSRTYVDKRTFSPSAVTKSGTAVPSGGSHGDLYIRTGSSPATGQATLYFNNSGTWENLAKYVAMGTTGTSNLVLRDGSGNFAAGMVTANVTGALTGNADTATTAAAWTTARTLTVSGAATGTVSVKGDAAMSLALTTTLPSIYVGTAPSSPKANDLWIQV
jgi:hypothetical protein